MGNLDTFGAIGTIPSTVNRRGWLNNDLNQCNVEANEERKAKE